MTQADVASRSDFTWCFMWNWNHNRIASCGFELSQLNFNEMLQKLKRFYHFTNTKKMMKNMFETIDFHILKWRKWDPSCPHKKKLLLTRNQTSSCGVLSTWNYRKKIKCLMHEKLSWFINIHMFCELTVLLASITRISAYFQHFFFNESVVRKNHKILTTKSRCYHRQICDKKYLFYLLEISFINFLSDCWF